MKKTLIIIGICTLMIFIVGCGGGSKMVQSTKKNEFGLPKMDHQIAQDQKGQPMIDVTGELAYPKMVSYEGAAYDFTCGDMPDVVANYFVEKLDGAELEKTELQGGTEMYTVTWKDIIIQAHHYTGGTLIRYKKILKKK